MPRLPETSDPQPVKKTIWTTLLRMATAATAAGDKAREVLPANTYGSIVFAFAPPCADSCADNDFGNSSLNSPYRNFLLSSQIAATSPLVRELTTLVSPLQEQTDGGDSTLIVVFVPPCARAVATACAIGEELKWRVRVE